MPDVAIQHKFLQPPEMNAKHVILATLAAAACKYDLGEKRRYFGENQMVGCLHGLEFAVGRTMYLPKEDRPLGTGTFEFLEKLGISGFLFELIVGILKDNLREGYVGEGFEHLFSSLGIEMKNSSLACIGGMVLFDGIEKVFRYNGGMLPSEMAVEILREGYERFWVSEKGYSPSTDDTESRSVANALRTFMDSRFFLLYLYIHEREKDLVASIPADHCNKELPATNKHHSKIYFISGIFNDAVLLKAPSIYNPRHPPNPLRNGGMGAVSYRVQRIL